jgi:hypothetical protein
MIYCFRFFPILCTPLHNKLALLLWGRILLSYSLDGAASQVLLFFWNFFTMGHFYWSITYPLPPRQGKKMNPLGCMFSHLISCLHILFLDMVATNLLPQLIPLLQSTPYLLCLLFIPC